MLAYLNLLRDVVTNGDDRQTRNAMTRSVFTRAFSHDLRTGFPLLTTKKVPFSLVAAELCWFLKGSEDIGFLHRHNCHIWDANVETWLHRRCPRDAGRIYGVQWRRWRANQLQLDNTYHVDQIQQLLSGIVHDPYNRRHVVSAWRPDEFGQMCLPPCHTLFQCYCAEDSDTRVLDLTMYQRSCDLFLGVPFNIASYALLLEVLAKATGRVPRMLNIVFGDLHLYHDHMGAVLEQLDRDPQPLPEVTLNSRIKYSGKNDLLDLTPDDFELCNYSPHAAIKAAMVV